MWSRLANISRTLVVLLACAVLSACLYKPLYGGKQPAQRSAQQSGIQIPLPDNRTDQLVRSALLEALAQSGIEAGSPHRLALQVREQQSAFGIRRDKSPTRKNLSLTVSYSLTDLNDSAEPVLRGSSQAITSFDIVISDYANLIAARDARKRAAREAARRIIPRLAAHFSR